MAANPAKGVRTASAAIDRVAPGRPPVGREHRGRSRTAPEVAHSPRAGLRSPDTTILARSRECHGRTDRGARACRTARRLAHGRVLPASRLHSLLAAAIPAREECGTGTRRTTGEVRALLWRGRAPRGRRDAQGTSSHPARDAVYRRLWPRANREKRREPRPATASLRSAHTRHKSADPSD